MGDMIDKARVLEIITAARGISQKTVDAIAALPPADDAVEAMVKAAEPTLDEALAVVCAAMANSEKWGAAVNAAMPILNADMDASSWNTVAEVRNAINAALAAIRAGGKP